MHTTLVFVLPNKVVLGVLRGKGTVPQDRVRTAVLSASPGLSCPLQAFLEDGCT